MMGTVIPASVAEWKGGGRCISTGSGSVFVRVGRGEAPALLLLHGYPSSSYDYRAVVPHLGDRGWVTLDFLGFGSPTNHAHTGTACPNRRIWCRT
jgi:pimeloyl-ACP methyl ester carboxylesterase